VHVGVVSSLCCNDDDNDIKPTGFVEMPPRLWPVVLHTVTLAPPPKNSVLKPHAFTRRGVTRLRCAQMAERIEIPFEMETLGNPRPTGFSGFAKTQFNENVQFQTEFKTKLQRPLFMLIKF